jgi:uncharacterized membrane protein
MVYLPTVLFSLGEGAVIPLIPVIASEMGSDVAFAALVAAALVGGQLGAWADSVLGATVQAVYWCPTCDKETERRIHTCGTPTRLYRGRLWMDNEVVNLTCAAVGALGGALVYAALRALG